MPSITSQLCLPEATAEQTDDLSVTPITPIHHCNRQSIDRDTFSAELKGSLSHTRLDGISVRHHWSGALFLVAL